MHIFPLGLGSNCGSIKNQLVDPLFGRKITKNSVAFTVRPPSPSGISQQAAVLNRTPLGVRRPRCFRWRVRPHGPDPRRALVVDGLSTRVDGIPTHGNPRGGLWPHKGKCWPGDDPTGLVPKDIKLDNGWPESADEHVTLVQLQRECTEYIKDML